MHLNSFCFHRDCNKASIAAPSMITTPKYHVRKLQEFQNLRSTSPLQPHMHNKKKTRNMAYTQQARFINDTIKTSVKREKDKVKLHSSSIKKTREENKVGFPYLVLQRSINIFLPVSTFTLHGSSSIPSRFLFFSPLKPKTRGFYHLPKPNPRLSTKERIWEGKDKQNFTVFIHFKIYGSNVNKI